MKKRMLKSTIPVILAIMEVVILLAIANYIIDPNAFLNISKCENQQFFFVIIPIVAVLGILVQFFIAIPLWNRFRVEKKVIGINLFQFILLITLIGGLVFGFLFWERDYGIIEFWLVTATGVSAIGVYWVANALVMSRL